jgi:hypothetical protein
MSDHILTLIEVRDGVPVYGDKPTEPGTSTLGCMGFDPPVSSGETAKPLDTAPVSRDLVVRPGGAISTVADAAEPTPVSYVPPERMAATGWQEVFDQVRDLESGTGSDLTVQPGGAIHKRDEAGSQPVSVVPAVRMAAGAVSHADAVELSALDPANVENWRPVRSSGGEFSGWLFDLQPPYQAETFTFLTFRNPARGYQWDIASIRPNSDHEFGHDPHMIRTQVGGRSMPILCGPGGMPSPTLTEVRGVAAKWMYYTSARMAGLNPGFSL